MITVTYESSQAKQFDLLVDADRKLMIASLMTPPEMAAFFKPGEANTAAKKLGLKVTGSELKVCQAIHKHFHG